MTTRKNPETSKEAFRSLKSDELAETYKGIILALSRIGEGHFEDIALQMRVKPEKVWKRLSELAKDGLIYRPGTKKPLRSGRNGYTWMLTKEGLPKTDKSEKALSGKSVSDYAKELIRQPTLF
jgi:predicted ArsR family transcriptional regulator